MDFRNMVIIMCLVLAVQVHASPIDNCYNNYDYYWTAVGCVDRIELEDCDALLNVTACVDDVFVSCPEMTDIFLNQNINGFESLKARCSSSIELWQPCDVVTKSMEINTCVSPYMNSFDHVCNNLQNIHLCYTETVQNCSAQLQNDIVTPFLSGFDTLTDLCKATTISVTTATTTQSAIDHDCDIARKSMQVQSCIDPYISSFNTLEKVCEHLQNIEWCYTDAIQHCTVDLQNEVVSRFLSGLDDLKQRCEEIAISTTTTQTNITSTTTTTPTTPTTTSTTTTPTTTTTSTTTTPTTSSSHEAPSYKCHSCHSGGVDYHQTSECPASGQLNGWAATHTITCQGPCVTAVKRYPLGDVIRGCSDMYHLGNDVTSPETGCHVFGQDVLCFCTGDKCNTDDLRARRAGMVREIRPRSNRH